MALNDIVFQESNTYGSDFIVEITLGIQTNSLSDIVLDNNTSDDEFVYELRRPITIIDNRRKIR